jgi:hypothetical protein
MVSHSDHAASAETAAWAGEEEIAEATGIGCGSTPRRHSAGLPLAALL